jgi:transmembrane sensor
MTPNDEEIRTAIATQAAEWFIANQSDTLPETERAAFLAWLKTSPVHVREFLGVAGVAQDLGRAVARPEVSLEAFLRDMQPDSESVASWPRSRAPSPETPRSWPSWGRRAVAAAAAVVMLIAAALVWNARDGQWLGLPRGYETARGGRASIGLPDGSVLQLDTASSVTVRFTRAERVVTLRRGQLFVQVAHDATRRFRVSTQQADAIAVGTRFNVRRHPGVTTVTVAEGVVSVQRSAGSAAATGRTATLPAVRVTAGEMVQISDTGGVPSNVSSADLVQALAWLEHRIVFNEQPLAEVITEFNRYAVLPIEVDDITLEALPISGSFDASDAASFVQFLETLPGVTVQRTATRYRVSRAAATD